jgi:uncharacterized protein YciI
MTTRRRTLAACAALPLAALRPASAQTPPADGQPSAVPANLFAIEFRTGVKWDAAKEAHEQAYFREHSANLRRLRDSGALLLGARYADKGLVIVAAESEARARALVDVDPSVQNQVFAYALHPFHVFYPGCVQTPGRK